MKSTLRTKIAAAALALTSVGALVAAQPASAAIVRTTTTTIVRHDDRRDDHRADRDNRAPAIFGMTPSQGARVGDRGRTQISARFSDDRSGIDARAVTLRVDGRDVTRSARVDNNDVRFADDLRPGRHTAELVVRDRAGNVARQSWSFEVAGHDFGRYNRHG